MKIYSWELINIILIFPGIFAITLLIEGIYKLRVLNWMGLVSFMAGVILLCVLTMSYFLFAR